MSKEEIKELIRRFYENPVDEVLKNAGDLLAPDFVYHTLSGDLDRDMYKKVNAEMLSAFPDVSYSIDDMIVENDTAAERWTMTGTHQAEFNGIPATNKQIVLKGVSYDRVKGGKIAETWMFYDSLTLLKQLGVA